MNATAQPASTVNVLRGDTDAVLSRISSAEGEFALAGTTLGDYTVVVVEGLLHGDKDAYVWLRLEGLGGIVPHFGVVMACACQYMP